MVPIITTGRDYSILMQGVCDGIGKFLSVSCGFPGSMHDARMLRMSGFYERVVDRRYIFVYNTDL